MRTIEHTSETKIHALLLPSACWEYSQQLVQIDTEVVRYEIHATVSVIGNVHSTKAWMKIGVERNAL
jgi:hypothetical protein